MRDMLRVYHHDDCLGHDPGAGHPESPARARQVLDTLRASALRARLAFVEAPLGNAAQLALAHTDHHIARVRDNVPTRGHYPLDSDTQLSPGSLDAALRAVGAACAGVDALIAGDCAQVFCATRPPGHHATTGQAMGFCVFNQAAIAALHAQQHHALRRVAVVDFDVHHGNGTQDILLGRPGLFYLSTHQSPYYPGTGLSSDNRSHNVLNLPLPAGTDDAAYRERFNAELLPALDAFQPQLLIVSAGFDAHAQDPLAGLALNEHTYAWLGQVLRNVANTHANGRLLSILEGGYNLPALAASVAAYLEGSLHQPESRQ